MNAHTPRGSGRASTVSAGVLPGVSTAVSPAVWPARPMYGAARGTACAIAGPLAVMLALPSVGMAESANAARRRRAPLTELSSAVVETVRVADIYDRPRARRGYRRGRLARGARFAALDRATGPGCREPFVRIADRAWVCGLDLRGSREPATAAPAAPAAPPSVPDGRGDALPARYVITRNAPVWPTLEDAEAGHTPATLVGVGGFVRRRAVTRGGVRYLKTPRGWVRDADAVLVGSSRLHGASIDGGPGARFGFVIRGGAWVYDRSGHRIHDAPALAQYAFVGALGAPLRRRGQVLYPLVERSADDGERVADADADARGETRYVRDRDVGVAEITRPPSGVATGERWIDVDRSQQVLVAYEGARPVFATLVSTAPGVPAPGRYRIEDKRAVARLRAKPGWRRQWDVHVPWMMSIGGWLALHVAYWHEDFGTARSAGCVNLSPHDARWVWQFTEPALPPGWIAAYATPDAPGTLIRVRR